MQNMGILEPSANKLAIQVQVKKEQNQKLLILILWQHSWEGTKAYSTNYGKQSWVILVYISRAKYPSPCSFYVLHQQQFVSLHVCMEQISKFVTFETTSYLVSH